MFPSVSSTQDYGLLHILNCIFTLIQSSKYSEVMLFEWFGFSLTSHLIYTDFTAIDTFCLLKYLVIMCSISCIGYQVVIFLLPPSSAIILQSFVSLLSQSHNFPLVPCLYQMYQSGEKVWPRAGKMSAVPDNGLNVLWPASYPHHVLRPWRNSVYSSHLHHGIHSCMFILGWNSEIHILQRRRTRIAVKFTLLELGSSILLDHKLIPWIDAKFFRTSQIKWMSTSHLGVCKLEWCWHQLAHHSASSPCRVESLAMN